MATVGFLGDTHCNKVWTLDAIRQLAPQCDYMFQVGDFGFWPRHDMGISFLKALQKELEALGRILYWIDGNHEDHPMLAVMMTRKDEDGFCYSKKYPNIRYSGRGHIWTWGGKVFGSLGGAASVDRKWRTEGRDWFPGERISEWDTVGFAGNKVDVLITHDAPANVNMRSSFPAPKEDLDLAAKSRAILQTVVEATEPQVVVHGHWHQRKTSQLILNSGKIATVQGLHCDKTRFESGKSWCIVDTETLEEVR